MSDKNSVPEDEALAVEEGAGLPATVLIHIARNDRKHLERAAETAAQNAGFTGPVPGAF
jgi:hypothetical protein